jgi:hypothetical protein
MQIFFALLYGCLNNLILIGKLLTAILAILSIMLGIQLHDRFNIRERLTRRKKGMCRVLKNFDQYLINFFDNRK